MKKTLSILFIAAIFASCSTKENPTPTDGTSTEPFSKVDTLNINTDEFTLTGLAYFPDGSFAISNKLLDYSDKTTPKVIKFDKENKKVFSAEIPMPVGFVGFWNIAIEPLSDGSGMYVITKSSRFALEARLLDNSGNILWMKTFDKNISIGIKGDIIYYATGDDYNNTLKRYKIDKTGTVTNYTISDDFKKAITDPNLIPGFYYAFDDIGSNQMLLYASDDDKLTLKVCDKNFTTVLSSNVVNLNAIFPTEPNIVRNMYSYKQISTNMFLFNYRRENRANNNWTDEGFEYGLVVDRDGKLLKKIKYVDKYLWNVVISGTKYELLSDIKAANAQYLSPTIKIYDFNTDKEVLNKQIFEYAIAGVLFSKNNEIIVQANSIVKKILVVRRN